MDQQTFLRLAKRELGFSYPRLAAEIGVSPRTIEKWSRSSQSDDHREMPLIARKFIGRLLEERKREQILAGDRDMAEAVDAIMSHVSREKYRDALRTFDELQITASMLVPMSVASDRPGYFRTLSDKNAWNENEEIRIARSARKKGTAAR